MKNIENISLGFLSLDDYQELKEAMIEVYNIEDPYWKKSEISSLIKKFPEGQIVIRRQLALPVTTTRIAGMC